MDGTFVVEKGTERRTEEIKMDACTEQTSGKRVGSPLDFEVFRSAKSPRKSCRRSSLAVGRIVKTLPTVSTELHNHIPTELPNDERLAMLFEAANQYALNTLEREYVDNVKVKDINSEAKEKVDYLIAEWRTDGHLKDGEKRNPSAPNPVNLEMDQTIKDGTRHKDRLLAECSEWDRLLALKARSAEDAERACQENEPIVAAERPDSLPGHYSRFLDNRPDYNAMLENLKNTKERAVLCVDAINSFCGRLTKWQKSRDEILQEHASLLHAHTFSGLPDLGNITNFASMLAAKTCELDDTEMEEENTAL